MQMPSATDVGHLMTHKFQQIRSHRFFSDRLSVTILVLNLALVGITMTVLLIRVRPTSVPVPVHYSSLVGFEQLGPWWQLYGIGLFAIGAVITNTALAMASFTRSRITSFFLMSGAFVVAIFSLIISLAITAVV
ncbi:MAG TPA: hypothetical protein VLE72_01425 [Candidatus Saccharimonadales bacterium]|nr:hypothetical protein [Candidatus Saccharimonadales bacterium]